MIKIICGRWFSIALAILSLVFMTSPRVQAQGNSKSKAAPGLQLMLLTEEEPPGPPNIVFVTSIAYTGNLGGLEDADQKCQERAEAGGLPKNTYKAWLSTSSVNAIDRLGSARGWVRVDGKPFADSKADIAAGKIFHPIRVDEFGNSPSSFGVWTGTYPDGTVDPDDTCAGWTSSSVDDFGADGSTDGTTGLFTSFGSSTCERSLSLYCFGVENKSVVTVKPTAGRIAFFARSAWTSGGGLASADQICNQEAAQAGLSGSFKAFLTPNGDTAASRFSVSGLPWVRRDGLAIAPTTAELFSAQFLDTAINQSADGLEYFGNWGAWTGAASPSDAGTAQTTCNNWTSSSNADTGETGRAGSTYRGHYFSVGNNLCNAVWNHLYCLQE